MKWGRKISKSLKEKKEKKKHCWWTDSKFPVVNSMVSQAGIALRWMSPWAEVYCWLKCMNGAKGWSWVIRRDRCRKRALSFCRVANCSVWWVYPGGGSWRSLQPLERTLLIFVPLLQPRIASPLTSTSSGCFPKQWLEESWKGEKWKAVSSSNCSDT